MDVGRGRPEGSARLPSAAGNGLFPFRDRPESDSRVAARRELAAVVRSPEVGHVAEADREFLLCFQFVGQGHGELFELEGGAFVPHRAEVVGDGVVLVERRVLVVGPFDVHFERASPTARGREDQHEVAARSLEVGDVEDPGFALVVGVVVSGAVHGRADEVPEVAGIDIRHPQRLYFCLSSFPV